MSDETGNHEDGAPERIRPSSPARETLQERLNRYDRLTPEERRLSSAFLQRGRGETDGRV